MRRPTGVYERGADARDAPGTWEAQVVPTRTGWDPLSPRPAEVVSVSTGARTGDRVGIAQRGEPERCETAIGASELLRSTRETGELAQRTPWREGRGRIMEPTGGNTTGTPMPDTVSTRLRRIAELARGAPDMAIRSLSHHIDEDFLREAYARTRKDGATGVDGQTAAEYERNLTANVRS